MLLVELLVRFRSTTDFLSSDVSESRDFVLATVLCLRDLGGVSSFGSDFAGVDDDVFTLL